MIAAIGSVLLAAAMYKAFRISPRCKDDVDSTSTASSHVDIATPTTKYDVFLSFRGEDTRNNFASYLYKELRYVGIHTFMDHKLRKGEQIAPILLKTIEESKISVIIFSKDYASSTWCMDELVHILECKDKHGRIVIPIFYNVDPSNIRKQNGSFGDGFAKLKRRLKHNQEKLQKWRDALDQSASLSGWDSNSTNSIRPESKLVEEIVKDILSKLNYEPSPHLEGLVGIARHIENIEKLLDEAPIVGIWGMGGAGKTTIAKAIFEKLKVQFDAFSFIENVKEQLARIRMDELQKNCLVELLKDEDINTYDIKSPFVRNRLKRKKILFILDDVDNSIIAEDLTRVSNWLGKGSRIIITSRDMQVLKNALAKAYHIPSLDFDDAFHLFSLRAFKQNEPSRGYMKLSKSVVSYCQGNPLALVVLGCFLHGRGKEDWESALDKLNQDPPKHIVDVLKVTFDGLDDKQQNVFFEISFLVKEGVKISLNTIRQIHGSFANIDTSVLRERSLISFDHDGYINMHDLVREMGLQIARQQLFSDPKRPVRLWRPEDIDDFFMSNRGEEAIRCLSVDISKIKRRTLRSIKLQNMDNLIYLNIYKSDWRKTLEIMNIGEDVDYLLKELRFFSWECCPLSYVPLNSCAQNLVEFQMLGSDIQQLWNGDVHFPNLKGIQISGSRYLTALPDLAQAPNIEWLSGDCCESLVQIHSSTVLPKLTKLTLAISGGNQIKMGDTMKGRNAGLVCVGNYLDLRELSFNKVMMKVLACEEGRVICGVECKHMLMPLENREMEVLKMEAHKLACILPFVRKVEWSNGPIEFGDFNYHYTSYVTSGEDQKAITVFVRRHGEDQRVVMGSLRRQVVNHNHNDKEVEQEDELMPQTNNIEMPLIRLPSGITRWSLLTHLELKESEVIGNKARGSFIPQVSILRSLALSDQFHKRTPLLLDLSLSLCIPSFPYPNRSWTFCYSTCPSGVQCRKDFSCLLIYGVDYFHFSHSGRI